MVDEKSLRGKKARKSGQLFELRVRKDLESDGWTVCKFDNNVELPTTIISADAYTSVKFKNKGKLIIAKRKYNPYNKVMTIGVGFPDFVVFRKTDQHIYSDIESNLNFKGGEFTNNPFVHEVIGVESKSNKYLDKEEKAKVAWLLENKIFSKILVAYKGKVPGEILYTDERGLMKDDK